MAIFTAEKAQGYNPAPGIHSAAEVHVAEGKYDAPGTLALNDLILLCKVPPSSIPIDARLEMDDLDSGAGALVGSLALVEMGGSDIIANSELIKDTNIGIAGGVARMDKLDAARRAVLEVSVEKERYVAFKVTTAASAAQAGRVKASVLFRGKEQNE